MRKTILICILICMFLLITGLFNHNSYKNNTNNLANDKPDSKVLLLEKGLSAVRFDGEYGFDKFIEQKGASSDSDVVSFLMSYLKQNNISFNADNFGCSTIMVKNPDGDSLFGRNFDWKHCNALIVQVCDII